MSKDGSKIIFFNTVSSPCHCSIATWGINWNFFVISPQSCVGPVKVSFFAFVWMIINHCNFIINYILFWPRILYIKCLKILLQFSGFFFFLSLLLFYNIDYSHSGLMKKKSGLTFSSWWNSTTISLSLKPNQPFGT